ncbi:Death-associated protein kinase [Alteripontixanthobacter maritimus]|uniref:Death-associated protein kinase n=1 Tax=Alteripontixanthobacter maritimus TaxID=2161824 RepID=A0A369Q2G0_9SPHN|nr:ankyrin repeat domain-containing protein [Alteripontixanthobacter maritimus]RDC59091.1 Death-associated protein kinase [Alteripontixanthobacter maritimus]
MTPPVIRSNILSRALQAVLAALLAVTLAVPASAQNFSEGYQFLEAVKKLEGDKVMDQLNAPGSVVVNTRDRSSGETALHIVARQRENAWLSYLLGRGANPNIADYKGITPLMVVSGAGNVEGAAVLLKAGALADVANSAGETPLISAVHRRDLAMVKLLLDSGANADRNDNSGRSARDYAALLTGGERLVAAFADADEASKETKPAQIYGPSL